jgi:hypothetical protein
MNGDRRRPAVPSSVFDARMVRRHPGRGYCSGFDPAL